MKPIRFSQYPGYNGAVRSEREAPTLTSSRYDPEADAAYFKLSEGDVFESEEVAPDIVLDFDREGRLVGMEVLNAKARLAAGEWTKAPLPGAAHVEAAE